MSDAIWTRATYMDQTRAQADARSSSRWTEADVRYALGLVHMREWKGLLNANRMLRFAARTVAQGSTGLIALSALDSGSGNTQERLYRILDVTDGTTAYREIQFLESPVTQSAGGSANLWHRVGDNLQCLPAASGQSMTVYVNHVPTPMDQLSADTIAAEFPRDYEMLLAFEAAAWLLAKGGAETDAGKDLQGMAAQVRGDMLADLARVSTSPLRLTYPDRASEWGG